MAEIKRREEEEDAQRSKEFETNNPDFCAQMIGDMKTRSEARWVVRSAVVHDYLDLAHRMLKNNMLSVV